MRVTVLIIAASLAASPASACIALFSPCADDLPMAADSFQVHAVAGGWLTGPSPNPAVLESAAQGCARRGFPQFIIAGAQNGQIYNQYRFFNAWGNGYGISGNSISPPPRRTTTALVKCVRAGGLSTAQYLNANA